MRWSAKSRTQIKNVKQLRLRFLARDFSPELFVTSADLAPDKRDMRADVAAERARDRTRTERRELAGFAFDYFAVLARKRGFQAG